MPIPGVTGSSDNRQPGTPTIGAATAGNASVSVAFTAPDNTGKPNTSLTYTATTTPSSITGTGSSSPVTISGLANGTSYTAVVKLNNTVQDSLSSAASNSFTPVAPGPFFPPFFPFFPPFFPFFPYFTAGPIITNTSAFGAGVPLGQNQIWGPNHAQIGGSYSQFQSILVTVSSGYSNTDMVFPALVSGLTANTFYTFTVTLYSGLNQTGLSASQSGSFTTSA
jgi:hypothetical protein